MIWTKYKIETKFEAADIAASILFDNGIVGAEIEDNKNLSKAELDQMYVDIPKVKNDNDDAYVIFYVALIDDINIYNDLIKEKSKVVSSDTIDNSYMSSVDNIYLTTEFEKVLLKIKLDLSEYQSLMDMGSLKISKSEIDDAMFLNNWKNNFKRIDIDNVSIIPSFDKNITKLDDDKINIYIDPGSAFGTGQHETTKLCIRGLLDYSENEDNSNQTYLDIGTGSGILSILAYKLSFGKVVAIDVDSYVEPNLIKNLELNEISDCIKYDIDNATSLCNKIYDEKKYIYSFGNIIEDKRFRDGISSVKYDVITINILAKVIINMIKNADLYSFLADKGRLILSGILKDDEKNLINTLKPRFEIVNTFYDGDWVMIEAIKNLQCKCE